MTRHFKNQQHWIFAIAALAVWSALIWPVLQAMTSGEEIRGDPVSQLWLLPFGVFGAAVIAGMVLDMRPRLQWTVLWVQLLAIIAMSVIVNWAMMSMLLILVAWQAALTTTSLKAFSWVIFQTLAVLTTLALVPNPDTCWVHWMAFGLQLSVLFTANAFRREAETARALAQAQAVIAQTARDAERLRISRELHDAWGHELTALGLQLEIASHVDDPAKANDHVRQARGLAGALLAKVRDVVSTLREAERCDLKDALDALARGVPRPAIHVDFAPGINVTGEQAHTLMRCAQEAVTNAIKHAHAANLWLQVTSDEAGVRLVARDDGVARSATAAPGSGLLGMRERVEGLGGRLAVRRGDDAGFTLVAWLPQGSAQPA